MANKTYDAKSVSVIVNGVYLTDMAESMVEVEKDEDNYNVVVGAQGDTVRSKINNNLGTIKVTLQQTSPQISYLDGLANSGAVVAITVTSAGDPKETASATQAYVKKPAARTYGSEAEDREFEFQALDLKM